MRTAEVPWCDDGTKSWAQNAPLQTKDDGSNQKTFLVGL